jgi:hypothetical protein
VHVVAFHFRCLLVRVSFQEHVVSNFDLTFIQDEKLEKDAPVSGNDQNAELSAKQDNEENEQRAEKRQKSDAEDSLENPEKDGKTEVSW